MKTKSWREAKAAGHVHMSDVLWMEDEIDGLRAETVALEAELRAWRNAFPHFSYQENGGLLVRTSS